MIFPKLLMLFLCVFILCVAKLMDWGEDGFLTEAEIASRRKALRKEVAVWKDLSHRNVTKVNISALRFSK